MKILTAVIFVFLLSCQSQHDKSAGAGETQPGVSGDTSRASTNGSISQVSPGKNVSFPDSIVRKDQLSIDQIRLHTNIDSIYYTGLRSDVAFFGDTVMASRNGFEILVINYDDRQSCIYKFLLTMSPKEKRSISEMIVYTDCDRDESAGYSEVKYRFINDSVFETVTTYLPVNSGSKRVEKKRWMVNDGGRIVSGN